MWTIIIIITIMTTTLKLPYLMVNEAMVCQEGGSAETAQDTVWEKSCRSREGAKASTPGLMWLFARWIFISGVILWPVESMDWHCV